MEFRRLKQPDDAPKTRIGFTSQQASEVFPEMVSTDESGLQMLMKAELIPVLVKALQELSAKVKELEAKLGV